MEVNEKEKYFEMWEEEFYDPYSEDDTLEECYFESVAIGFFIAKGLKPLDALKMYDYCVENSKY